MKITPFPALNLPRADLKLTRKSDDLYVWCILRKKHLLLTPEEWVRQHAVHYLIEEKGYALGRMNSEHVLVINGQNRRCDIVVVDENGQALIIVECKAVGISIDEKTFLQTSNYVSHTKARFFWMTNGTKHVVMDCLEGVYLKDVPEFLR